LAEIGLLRPWGATGDVDNFEKAVYDMIQPNEKRKHTGIMSNDSLIIESHSQKFYSITPRYEISITYMNKIPDIVKKILRLDKQ
jgi:Holliday junction resolvase RusA-like endonuclease